jgi:hypothetical protein
MNTGKMQACILVLLFKDYLYTQRQEIGRRSDNSSTSVDFTEAAINLDKDDCSFAQIFTFQ